MATTPDSIAWARPEDVGMSRERLARIGDFLEAEIEGKRVPGAVALVARQGRIVHFKAYGRRSPASADLMALDTIFRIYSMTKPIVSVATVMLAEAGRIGLGDPLSNYLPAYAEAKVALPVGGTAPVVRPITVQDLLRHTSGLTYEWLDEGPVGQAYLDLGAGNRDRDAAEQALALGSVPLVAQPGTRWEYGRSTDVLGHVVEVVSGRPLGVHLHEALFAPLGMMETGFHVPDDFHERIAEPHPVDRVTGETIDLLDIRRPRAFESGGGGLVSTASDYARFLHMLASGGTLDGARLLSPATIAFMMSDHLEPDVVIGSDLLPPGYGFGLGFAVRRTRGEAAFPGSPGDAYWEGMAGTSFWIDPAERLYAVLMVQAPSERERYRRAFRQIVYGALTDTLSG